MSNNPIVSVIMPAYNAETYISQSIESVLDQTFKNWELIVVDDGSFDGTAAIIKAFEKLDNRIHYFYQKNGKQGKARNVGIRNSEGKYLAFLDADDTWTINKLEIQFEIISKNKDIDLIFSQGYILTDSTVSNLNVTVKSLWNTDNLNEFINQNQIPILSVLATRKSIECVNFFNESEKIQNAEDYHLWLKLLISDYKFISIEDRLFYYRVHTDQSTYQNKNLKAPIFYAYKDIFESFDYPQVRKLLFSKMKWLIFDESFDVRCLNLFIKHFNSKNPLIAFAAKRALKKPTSFNKKAVFKLITHFD